MDELIDFAKESYRLGREAARKGLLILAAVRYAQAQAMLQAVMILFDRKEITMTAKAQQAVVLLLEALNAAYMKVVSACGNGHRKNPDNAVVDVVDILQNELRLIS